MYHQSGPRRALEVAALAVTALTSSSCSTIGSDHLDPVDAQLRRERFADTPSGRPHPLTSPTDSVGQEFATQYADVFLPDVRRLELARFSAPVSPEGRVSIEIELDPEGKSGAWRGRCYRGKNPVGDLKRFGPIILGTYAVETRARLDTPPIRIMTLRSSSSIVLAEAQLFQIDTTGAGARHAAAGFTELGVRIHVQPTGLGRLLGLTSFLMRDPIVCTLIHGQTAQIKELRERAFEKIIERQRGAFVDDSSFQHAINMTTPTGPYRGEFVFRPKVSAAPPLTEAWLPPDGVVAAQEVFTVRAGTADQQPSTRVVGMDSAGVDVIDGSAIIHGSATATAPSRRVGWNALSETRDSPPQIETVWATTVTHHGISRRIELVDRVPHSAATPHGEFEAFLGGIAVAERLAGVLPGALAVRITPAESDGAAARGDWIEPPLGTVTWMQRSAFRAADFAAYSPESVHAFGVWSGRRALALAIAHVRGAHVIDEIRHVAPPTVGPELTTLLDLGQKLDAPVPDGLGTRAEFVHLILALEESPLLRRAVTTLSAPARLTLDRLSHVIGALRSDNT